MDENEYEYEEFILPIETEIDRIRSIVESTQNPAIIAVATYFLNKQITSKNQKINTYNLFSTGVNNEEYINAAIKKENKKFWKNNPDLKKLLVDNSERNLKEIMSLVETFSIPIQGKLKQLKECNLEYPQDD